MPKFIIHVVDTYEIYETKKPTLTNYFHKCVILYNEESRSFAIYFSFPDTYSRFSNIVSFIESMQTLGQFFLPISSYPERPGHARTRRWALDAGSRVGAIKVVYFFVVEQTGACYRKYNPGTTITANSFPYYPLLRRTDLWVKI